MRILLFISSLILVAGTAQAYPEFIGYGYSSCLTCHVNGQGGGPLSDYGRALWSAEISGRLFYSKTTTDEDMGTQSGFLGKTELPYWVRPHIKYRGIQVRRSPGSSQDTTKYYQMQADAGVTLQADQDGRFVAVGTWGNFPQNYGQGEQGTKNMLAREYYLRIQATKTWWLYAGLMEKVFGLRNIDHTSYQRTFQGFNMNNNNTNGISHAEGVMLQKIEDKWELTANYFIGHPRDQEAYKQKGFSAMGEFEVQNQGRLGASVFDAKNDLQKKTMYAIHYRQAVSKASAMIFEYGSIQNDNAAPTNNRTIGSYTLVQGLFNLTRGYNLKTTVERYNEEFKPEKPERWKYSFGFLMFPLPRLELRTEVINARDFSDQRAADDSWALQGQIHVSL